MTDAPRMMNLTLFSAPAGVSIGAWRRPDSYSDRLTSLEVLSSIAATAEQATLDALFLADTVTSKPTDYKRPPTYVLEPMTVLGALSARTSRIGLIATGSTSFIEPYNLARQMASIDHLSGGRAGWNIVTSFAGGQNFSTSLADHDQRYRRAQEYLEVVTALWDSWQDDAIVDDRASGTWGDPDRISATDFDGEYYQVAGPLNVPRSPQGWPVFAQAGSSPAGLSFAGRWAEIVFTSAPELVGAQQVYTQIKAQVASAGRDPDAVRVLPGFIPIIGETEREAKLLADELLDLIDYEAGLAMLQRQFPVDIGDLELDEPVPQERLVAPKLFEGNQTMYRRHYDLAITGATLRTLIRVKATASDHASAIGTAEQVADAMEAYFVQGGADGFMLMTPYLPDGLTAIAEQLVPVLRERGLFRKDYEGTTLRDHLGLGRPPGR